METSSLTDLQHPRDFLASRLLYRDGLMLVIDKPAGLPVHGRPLGRPLGRRPDRRSASRGGGGGDNLENYFDALRFGLPRPPALAHRLDRDTSGCLVLGRHPKALRKLGKLFAEGRIDKTYWAICKGAPEKPSGTVKARLAKITRGQGWTMRALPDHDEDNPGAQEDKGHDAGQDATTTYRTLARRDGLSFIEAKPKTGRTHQIRVHLSAIGAPILGDPQYGDLSPEDRAGPMMLHARRIVIPISASKPAVCVEAPPPPAMAALLASMKKDGGEPD